MKPHPAYFQTRFKPDVSITDWPQSFAIISGFATTGEVWPKALNENADRRLRERLEREKVWLRRVVGYSPLDEHAEPSWAVALTLSAARATAVDFLQDAIYWVQANHLFVTGCEEKDQLIPVGPFLPRVDVSGG